MVTVIATTAFRGNEGEWTEGDIKQVSPNRAHELIEAGHVIEHRQPKPVLEQVAAVIGATVAEPTKLPEVPGIPAKESEPKKEKEDKVSGLTKEDKAEGKTKEVKSA